MDAANYFDYYSGLTDKLEGITIPVNKTVIDYTLLEPYGVSAHIVPWNFPMSMLARSLACAFAAGNATVIKTAELTPLSTASHFAQAISNANVPNGLINVICGYGNVGKKLAKVLESLEMDIYTISRSELSNYKNFSINDLDRVVPQMNYIVNLLPLSKETKYLFDSRLFKKMKNVNFINIGRGQTVVERDLMLAIENNNLNAAALDVFEKEPLSRESDLLNNNKIILTPHVAGLDSQYWNRQLDLFRHNMGAYLTDQIKSFKNKIN